MFAKTEEKQHILCTMLHVYPQVPESVLATLVVKFIHTKNQNSQYFKYHGR